MNATREGFAVILARDALGDLPGEPPAPKPRRRRSTILRRVVAGVVILAVGLLVLGAILGRHRSNSEPTARPGGAVVVQPRRFVVHVEGPDATLLVTNAPVVLAGRTIGRVFMVDVERLPPRVPRVAAAFRADPGLSPTLANSRVELAMRGGRAYLVVVRKSGRSPRTAPGPGDRAAEVGLTLRRSRHRIC
jgi:hypothetical protein